MERLPTPRELNEFMLLLPLYLSLDKRGRQLILYMIETEANRNTHKKHS